METRDPESTNPRGRPSARLFLVLLAIIVLSIVAFLVLRPNPSGSTPKNNTPASSQ